MNCETALELLSASLDGELTSAEESQLQAHLDQCPNCRALQAELKGLCAACGEMEALPPAELKEQIMKNLPPQRPIKVIYWKRWGAMAAALALVTLVAWRLPHYLYEKDISQVTADALAETGSMDSPERSPIAGEISIAMDPELTDETPPYVDGDAVSANSYVPTADPGAGHTATTDTSAAGASFKYSWVVTGPGIAELSEEQAFDSASFDLATNGAETGAGAVHSRAALPSSAPRDSVYTVDSGDTDAVPEAVPDPGEEKAAAQPLEPVVEDVRDFSQYCAVITLSADATTEYDYPRQLQENGDMWYLVPRSVLESAPQALDDAPDYTLRLEGDDLTADAPYVLVVIPAARK